MKYFFIDLLRGTLRTLCRLTLWRYSPRIIGVTGSVGKTSTKLAIAAVLSKAPTIQGQPQRVRVSRGNLNSELGVALTVLGDWSERELSLVSRNTPAGAARVRKAFFWLKVLCTAAWRIAVKSPDRYPELLVLEYGADKPGDIKYLIKLARPTMGVITAVGDIPVHVEFYAGPEDVAREKGRLIESLNSTGFAVLNYDDATVVNLKDRTRARVMTYGFAQGADLRLSRFENRIGTGAANSGISFKIEYASSFVPVRMNGVLGRVHAYAAGAAAALGLIFGMNLVTISEALAEYRPAPGRTQLVPGIKHTLIIDDCYNASPLSMHAALDILRDAPGDGANGARRKVAVLGDMLEIGKYSIEAHERVGRLAAGEGVGGERAVDVLIAVGPRAKFIADAAREAGMKKSAIMSFDTADEAAKPVGKLLKQGDLVLVKGSHAMRLDKIVEEIREQECAASEV